MPKKKTTEEFIGDAKKVHGNKYEYSLVDYFSSQTRIKIICSEHGVFKQRPNDHLCGCGCPFCAGNIKLTKDIFIKKANKIHKNYYNYSLVDYYNTNSIVKIICPIHGIFEQKVYNHLYSKTKCPKCINNNIKKTKEQLINEFKIKHDDKYDYSLVVVHIYFKLENVLCRKKRLQKNS